MRARYLPLCLIALVAPRPSPAGGDEWPRFRGPNGQGVAAAAVPATWGETENVLWKAPVPADGWSSPVVASGRVYLTGTTAAGRGCHVLAFDAGTGKLVWDKEVFRQTPTRKEGKNSYATPTPVVAGDAVVAVFGGGGVACLGAADGAVRWTFTGVDHYSQHGLGASPVVYRNLVVMPYDGSSPGPDKKVGWQTPWDEAVVLALDLATGKEAWRARRGKSRIAHSTPAVVSFGGKDVLLSQAGDVVQGFDPLTGGRLWSVKNEGEGLVPSPVLGDRTVFTTPGWPKQAVRAWKWDGDDPAAAPRMLWQVAKNVPMMPTGVYLDGHLFVVSEQGFAACLDPGTGKAVWEARLPGKYSASLVAAGGKVVALSEEGEATVFPAGPEFEPVARNKLAGTFQATPAAAGGRLFLRSATHLYCVGK